MRDQMKQAESDKEFCKRNVQLYFLQNYAKTSLFDEANSKKVRRLRKTQHVE